MGVAVVLVAAVDTGLVLTHGDGPVGKATTTLAAAHDATLVAPDGASSPARAGERVPVGDVVRTGRSGSAQLATRGRAVYLGASAVLAVIDGDHQQLRTGRVVIDALHGPGLQLALAGDQVVVPAASATEAQRSVSVRVGSLSGPAQAIGASAQRLTIRGLAQAVIDGDALPSTTTPLHLNDDAGEAAAVPALVNDDLALNELADGINSSGRSTAGAIETAWTGSTSRLPRSSASSERVLPMVIADAAHGDGSAQSRYDRIVRWRRAGGSWGVVAALLNTDAGAVEAVFDTLQHHQPGGQIGTVSVKALANAPVSGVRPAHKASSGSRTGSGSTGTGGSGTSHPSSPPAGSGGGHHGGSPTPSPTPTPDPVKSVVGSVTGVLGTVVGLLPVKVPTKPLPLPTPTGGLLGGLLGER